MWRVIAIRAASIWRSVIQADSKVLSPKSPKFNLSPRDALPRIRPFMTLRCLTFFGINIALFLFSGRWSVVGGQYLDLTDHRPPTTDNCYLLLSSRSRRRGGLLSPRPPP